MEGSSRARLPTWLTLLRLRPSLRLVLYFPLATLGGACCLYRVSPPFVPSAIPILLYSVYAQVEGSRFGVPREKLLLSEFFRELLYQSSAGVAVSDIASRRVFPNQSLPFSIFTVQLYLLTQSSIFIESAPWLPPSTSDFSAAS